MENIILDDRYEIIEQIGVGGMAKVYKAKDKLLDRFVAIKILKEPYAEDDEFLKKFNNEAQSAAKLSHINIVNVFDIGQDLYNGQVIYYIVMEYVEGRTLKDYIVDEEKLSNHDIIDYSTQIAQALKTAHKAGIIHRDIKPQNILIDNYGLLKVTDFGIARVSSNATITYTSSILGTVHYISPEQAKGKIVDEKSDLYSLGAVMYEMATGKVPFDADNSVGIAVMHIQDQPVEPKELNPDLSDHLNHIIMKLLAKEPSERFLNANELIEALDDENYYVEEADEITQTARIPIVVPKEKSYEKVYYDNQPEEEIEEEPEEKEAVYVSNSEPEEDSAKRKKDKKIRPLFLVAIILLGAVYFFKNRTESKEVVEVPTVINLDKEQAFNELERRGLKANILSSEQSDEYEKGKVMSQDPTPNSKANRGSTVNLVISEGREVEVPDLKNMTISQAEETLKEKGLKLGRTNSSSSDEVEKDLIINQNPSPNTKLQTGTEIDVTVSTGSDQRVKTVEVPNLIGKSEQDARAIVSQYGLSLRDVNYANSNDVARGIVMNQSISSGTEVAKNSKIDFTVSLGSEENKNNQDQDNDQDQNNNNDDNSNDFRNVVLNVSITDPADQFNVMVFDIVNGQRNQAIINQTMYSSDLHDGVLTLNVKARLGTNLEVLIDNQSYGVYEVNQ